MSLFGLSLGLTLLTGLTAYSLSWALRDRAIAQSSPFWDGLAVAIIAPIALVYPLEQWIQTLTLPPVTILPELAFAAGLPTVAEASQAPVSSTSNALSPLVVMAGLWTIGALVRLVYEGLREYRYAQLIWQSRPGHKPLYDRIKHLAQKADVKRYVEVRVLNTVQTPFVCGVIWPVLILPHDEIADGIILHELAHVKRQDVARTYLARLIGCLIWFNPFWFAIERRRRGAVEIEADRLALDWLGPDQSRDYAHALIEAARNTHQPTVHPAFGAGEKDIIKLRIKSIMTPQSRPTRTLSRLTAFLAASLVILPAAGAQALVNGSIALQPVTFTVAPVDGETTSRFGYRGDVPGMEDLPPNHRGHDIRAPEGTPVLAPADGVVTEAADADRYGNRVTIDHGQGFQTRYAHLQGFEIAPGDRVSAGDVIAYVGNTGASTGPHLHVEVFENGEVVDPALHLPGLGEE